MFVDSANDGNYVSTSSEGTFTIKGEAEMNVVTTTDCFEQAVEHVVGKSGSILFVTAYYDPGDDKWYLSRTPQEVIDAINDNRDILCGINATAGTYISSTCAWIKPDIKIYTDNPPDIEIRLLGMLLYFDTYHIAWRAEKFSVTNYDSDNDTISYTEWFIYGNHKMYSVSMPEVTP